MRVIIPCAGNRSRWDNYLGIPKQLVRITDDEPILHRTVRLLREHGVDDIHIIARESEVDVFTVPGAVTDVARLDETKHDMDRFCSSRHLWSETDRTVIMFGDVYFSQRAVRIIASSATKRRWQVYGRPWASRITGCAHGEIFALSWFPSEYETIDAAIAYVVKLYDSNVINRTLSWELIRALLGCTDAAVRTGSIARIRGRMSIVDDETEDFDKPKNYDAYIARRSYRVESKLSSRRRYP